MYQPGEIMQDLLIPFVGAIAIALCGCNNAKSPDAVASDVAKTEQKADAKVDDKLKDLNNKDAKAQSSWQSYQKTNWNRESR